MQECRSSEGECLKLFWWLMIYVIALSGSWIYFKVKEIQFARWSRELTARSKAQAAHRRNFDKLYNNYTGA